MGGCRDECLAQICEITGPNSESAKSSSCMMSAWSDGASADDGRVGRAWLGRLEPVHLGVAGLAVGWKSVLDACGDSPGVA